jgi:hypothetical protein
MLAALRHTRCHVEDNKGGESNNQIWIPTNYLASEVRIMRCTPLAGISLASVETINEGTHRQLARRALFALEQALALYDAYQEKASTCDARIKAVLKPLSFRHGREVWTVAVSTSGHAPATDFASRGPLLRAVQVCVGGPCVASVAK